MSEVSGIVLSGPATNGSNDRALELPTILGRNLKRLRTRNGYSLDRLAQLSGVSRAMIGQIESAKSVPTVGLLARVAKALDVELANLVMTQEAPGHVILRGADAKLLQASGGKFTSRTLLSDAGGRGVEFHEVRIAPLHTEESEPHAPGTRESLIVARGTLAFSTVDKLAVTLNEGDALQFEADVSHSYRNPARVETVLYVVRTRSEHVRA
jgi:transcriptional regulator with XRE-family HTH domain